jgi:transposase InsO family protein
MEEPPMPWKETNVQEERMKFISVYLEHEWPVIDLCHAFGISRKTGYKYIERYLEYGLDGLKDRSRAPRNHPNRTPKRIETLIVNGRRTHPKWGPRKLLAYLKRLHPSVKQWPSPSTIGDIIIRRGLANKTKRIVRKVTPSQTLAVIQKPNDVWCADFKGPIITRDSGRCDPLTIMDAHSRFLLDCRNVADLSFASCKPVFERVFREFGLPRFIRTDNGSPFASTGLAGLTQLSVWWIKHGITPERIESGRPQQNGSHERMHRTLKWEAATPPAQNPVLQQKSFDRFRKKYNQQRPHESLKNKTPGDVYVCSFREFPDRGPEINYPDHMEVRKVHPKGHIKWLSSLFYISEALVGENVGLEQISEKHCRIHFGHVKLAVLDTETKKMLRFSEIAFS